MSNETQLSHALRFGGWCMIVLGALMALGNLPGPDAVLAWLLDLAFWPLDGTDHMGPPAAHLLTAIIGGVIIGWGATVLGLSGAAARAAPEAIRRIVIRGYLAWFLVDSLGSVIAGAPFNVIGNAAFLALLLWPFRPQRHAGPA